MGFPNLKNKHAEDSMYSPKEFMSYQKKMGKYPKFKAPYGVIFCYNQKLMDHILKNHELTEADCFAGKIFLLNETKGKIAIVGKFGIGAPVVAVLLEDLIALGIKRFISVGTAGTLQKDIKLGDIMVCEKAIRDEGVSHHYLKYSKYAHASKEMTEKIKKSLEKFNQKYFIGKSWTIDAPYRETVAEARQYQKEGVATAEMEAAALFAVAQYRKVKLGTILTISDSLAELEWKPNFYSNKTKKGLEILYKVALDALLDY